MKAPTYFNWPNKVWIISDPHFGDLGILRYERTQFESIDEHDSHIIKMINRYVQPGDTIVFLGDMGHHWEEPIKGLKKGLYKVLVMGNHDNLNKVKYTSIFNEVYNGPIFVNKFIILSHEPIPVSEHFINVHGHLHNSFLDDDHHLNVSAHMCDYIPLALDKVYDLTMSYPRIKAKFLKEWYADKYVFTDKDSRKDVYMFRDTGHVIPRETLKFIEDNFIGCAEPGEVDIRKYKFFHSRIARSLDFKSTENSTDIIKRLEEKYKSMEGTDESLWNS